MLEYDRIDVSEGIDTNETNSLRDCIIFHYRFFLMINFRFQPKVCNGCHNMTPQKSMNFNNVTIVTICKINYRILFWLMTKSKAVGRMKNADLSEKRGHI